MVLHSSLVNILYNIYDFDYEQFFFIDGWNVFSKHDGELSGIDYEGTMHRRIMTFMIVLLKKIILFVSKATPESILKGNWVF